MSKIEALLKIECMRKYCLTYENKISVLWPGHQNLFHVCTVRPEGIAHETFVAGTHIRDRP